MAAPRRGVRASRRRPRRSCWQTWEAGWATLFTALDGLRDADLDRPVSIRGESQTALAAIARQLAHYAGHAHQIVLLAKHLRGPDWRVLSIPRGQSQAYTDRLKPSPPAGVSQRSAV